MPAANARAGSSLGVVDAAKRGVPGGSIVRNLIRLNGRPCRPGRTWRKSTGLPSANRTAIATALRRQADDAERHRDREIHAPLRAGHTTESSATAERVLSDLHHALDFVVLEGGSAGKRDAPIKEPLGAPLTNALRDAKTG